MRRRLDPPHRTARQKNVIAVAIGEVPEVAIEVAAALVDEQQQIAVRVAHKLRHGARDRPDRDPALRIGEQRHGTEGLVALFRGRNRIEGAGLERSLERRPAGGRVAVIEMGGGSEETVAADFALERAGGQIGMGLAARLALDAGKLDPVFHVSTPRLT